MALENSFADPTIFFFNSGSTFFYHFPSSKWIFFSRFFILSNYLTFFFNVLYFPPIRLFRQGNIQNNLRKQSAKLSWHTISNRSVLLVWWLLIFWALFNRSLRLFRSSGSESSMRGGGGSVEFEFEFQGVAAGQENRLATAAPPLPSPGRFWSAMVH